uniref:Uncharacterized protein n=1 Tax=Pseudomonas marincola TaxID=437900 RepID=A0A653E2L6_9PSED
MSIGKVIYTIATSTRCLTCRWKLAGRLLPANARTCGTCSIPRCPEMPSLPVITALPAPPGKVPVVLALSTLKDHRYATQLGYWAVFLGIFVGLRRADDRVVAPRGDRRRLLQR